MLNTNFAFINFQYEYLLLLFTKISKRIKEYSKVLRTNIFDGSTPAVPNPFQPWTPYSYSVDYNLFIIIG